jgi:CRP-like cAMP-binding protein
VSEVPQNAVLRSLSREAYRRLSPHLAPVELKLGTHLYRDGTPVEWVYFPETSLLSIIATSVDGQTVETSMVGNEGGAGLIEASSSQVSGANCIVQVDGRAQRAPASIWRRLSVTDAEFTLMTFKLAELQLAESRQSGFCQAIHPVGQRLARWVAESTDRCGGRNPLPMTQQFSGGRPGCSTHHGVLICLGSSEGGSNSLLPRKAGDHRSAPLGGDRL